MDALRQDLKMRNIPSLCANAERGEAERTLVPLDGHTSVKDLLIARTMDDKYRERHRP